MKILLQNMEDIAKIIMMLLTFGPIILLVIGLLYMLYTYIIKEFGVSAWVGIKRLFDFRGRRIRKKRELIIKAERDSFYSIKQICLQLWDKNSVYDLTESQLDALLTIPKEKLKRENAICLAELKQTAEEENARRIQERNKAWKTSLIIIDMDIVTVLDADLERIKKEIELTQKEIEKIETVQYPDGVNESQKEAIKKLHVFSLKYQVNHDTLKAKLEYLKCAYQGLLTQKEYDEAIMAKRAFDAGL